MGRSKVILAMAFLFAAGCGASRDDGLVPPAPEPAFGEAAGPKIVPAKVSQAQAMRIAARAYRDRIGSSKWPTEADMMPSLRPEGDPPSGGSCAGHIPSLEAVVPSSSTP